MFVVIYESGMVTESPQDTWEALPANEPILMALIINNGVVVGMANKEKYWFANTAVAGMGGEAKVIEQIIGSKDGDEIIEIAQSVDGKMVSQTSKCTIYEKYHKPGRVSDEKAERSNRYFTRLFRGLRQ